ncbi:kelch-like protein 31 [Callorhinchus milii]|uniref:Kelch-like protein 31 n=1 Tax=Callorhinchus milii TaxID=7868 RepID=A0A4W3HFG5_CALMI|nr:kelch-like protein 31 [Callorhinchus milii]|eukprot:gi/632980280/ref/XP_007906947.1/ PREDICTED: kelch-like protein 31 [Callorhinchus milii]
MAPKKKSSRKNKSDKNELANINIVNIDEKTIDIDHLNHLNTLYDSGSNGFRCTATEVSNPSHGSNLLEEINKMRQERFLSDLNLVTKTKSFEVHKVVMAACSDYFRSMLKKDPSIKCVDVNDVSPLGLATAITYAYRGTLSLSLYTIGCTIATATQFKMHTLINMCSDFLVREMNVENCMYISNIAGTYGLNQVKESARKFIRENFLEFAETDQFMKLTHNQMNDLLMDDSLQLPSELTAFQMAMKWLEFDTKRVKHAADLLSNIRFGTISAHDLVSYVQPIPRMMQDPDCHRLLVDAMNYHLLPYHQNSMQSRRTKLRGGQKVLVTVGGRPALTEKALSREILYRDPENGWNKLAEMPAKSFNQCVVVMDGFLYVAGGEDQNDARNQAKHAVSNLSRYDPRFNTWFHLAGLLQKRTHFSMCVYNGLLFAIGGRNAEGSLASMECYIPSVNQWQTKASMDIARCCHSASVIDGKILATGGYINNGYSRTVCSYDPAIDTWRECANLSTPRGWHCTVTLEDRAYVMGGSQLGPHGERVDVIPVESYNPHTGQWSYVAPLPIGVSTAGVTTLGGRVYLAGGWNESVKKYKSCIQTYNPELNEWTDEDELPEATVGVSCCTIMLPSNKLRESRASSVASAPVSI